MEDSNSKKSLEEEIMVRARKDRKEAVFMCSTRDMVEDMIKKAMEKGAFDNLAGQGKPLNLQENPYEPSEWRMAFKILKDNDCSPYWIELGKDIDAQEKRLQTELERFVSYWKRNLTKNPVSQKRFIDNKQAFLLKREAELNRLYKKILDYNLHCPIFSLNRMNIDVKAELEKTSRLIDAIKEHDN